VSNLSCFIVIGFTQSQVFILIYFSFLKFALYSLYHNSQNSFSHQKFTLLSKINLRLALACICCASVAVMFCPTLTHKLLASNQVDNDAFCCIKSNKLKLELGTGAVGISIIAPFIAPFLQSTHISLGHNEGLVKSVLLGIRFLSYKMLCPNPSLTAFLIIKFANLLCILCLSSNKSIKLFQ